MTVYFAEEVGTGAIKIGYTDSTDPQTDRIDPALTMTSHEVVVRAVLRGASKQTEKSLHEAFKSSRIYRFAKEQVNGLTEFFRPTAAIWALVGYVARTGVLPCPPDGCADIVWVPEPYGVQ